MVLKTYRLDATDVTPDAAFNVREVHPLVSYINVLYIVVGDVLFIYLYKHITQPLNSWLLEYGPSRIIFWRC